MFPSVPLILLLFCLLHCLLCSLYPFLSLIFHHVCLASLLPSHGFVLHAWESLCLWDSSYCMWNKPPSFTHRQELSVPCHRLMELAQPSLLLLILCCSVPEEEGCLVQAGLHFVPPKKLFVSMSCFIFWPWLPCIHLSNKNKCRKWKKNRVHPSLLCLSVFVLHCAIPACVCTCPVHAPDRKSVV